MDAPSDDVTPVAVRDVPTQRIRPRKPKRDIRGWISTLWPIFVGLILATVFIARAFAAKADDDDVATVAARAATSEIRITRIEANEVWVNSTLYAIAQKVGVPVPMPPTGLVIAPPPLPPLVLPPPPLLP